MNIDLAYTVRIRDSVLNQFPLGSGRPGSNTRSLPNVKGVQYSTVMLGGYDIASFGIEGDVDVLAAYRDMLGSDVSIHDGLGIQVWEGFVNTITVNHGRAEYRGGPLMDVVNRVKLRYTTPRFATNPPTGGIEKETAFFEASGAVGIMSRQMFGTLSEIIVPPRPLSDSEANALAVELSNTLAMPKTTISVGNDASSETSAKFECLGYFHLTKKLIADYYGDNGSAPLQPASQVLSYPFFMNSARFFKPSGVVTTLHEPNLRLFNEQAESAHAFLETQSSVVNSYRDTQYTVGVYNNRSVHVRRVERPAMPDVLVSIHGGIVGGIQGSGIYVMPGMYASIVDVPFAMNPIQRPGFIIDNIEFSDGNLSLNAGTFSALDNALRERGV